LIGSVFSSDLLGGLLATAISSFSPAQRLKALIPSFKDDFFSSEYCSGISNCTDSEDIFPPGADHRLDIDFYYLSSTGYSLESVPAIVAIVILFIYCAYVMVFVIYTIYTGNSSSSWNSISELVALSLNSERPTQLGDISAGISTISIYKEPVSILANKNDNVEIVFMSEKKDMSDFSVVEKNKSY
jgi:hypothetical protein